MTRTIVARRSHLLCSAVAIAATVALAGCSSSGDNGSYSSNTASSSGSAMTASSTEYNNSSNDNRDSARAASTQNRLYYPTGDKNSAVLCLERTGPSQVRVGQPYNYQIKVTNLTNDPLQGVTVQEMLPGSFQVSTNSASASNSNGSGNEAAGPSAAAGVSVGSDASGGNGAGASANVGLGNNATANARATTQPGETNLAGANEPAGGAPSAASAGAPNLTPHTYAIGELGPHQSRTLNISGTPSQPGTLSSCLSVSYAPTLCTTALVTNPQLRLNVEAMGTGDLCQPQTLRYTVSNTGTGDLTGVRVDDPLPDGLTTRDGSNHVSFSVGTVAQGQSRAFEVQVKPTRAGNYTTIATATADQGLSARAQAAAIDVHAPRLAVSMAAPEKDYLGQTVNYKVTIKNVGDAPARNTSVRLDTSGAAVAGANEPGEAQTAAATEGGEQLGELAPGQSRTLTLPYTPKQQGDVRVAAVATDPCAGTATANAMTHIQTLPALLLQAVDDHDPVHVGDTVTYNITVLNQGFGADKDVHVVVTLPQGEQYVSSSGASQGTLSGSKLTFAPVANINPKQTLTWTVTVKAMQAADVRLRVDMTSQSFPEPAVKLEPTRLY